MVIDVDWTILGQEKRMTYCKQLNLSQTIFLIQIHSNA